jgi:hypothetical protein
VPLSNVAAFVWISAVHSRRQDELCVGFCHQDVGLFGQSHVIDEVAARLPLGSPKVDRRTVLSLIHHKQSLGQVAILRFDDAIHPRLHQRGVTVFCAPELSALTADEVRVFPVLAVGHG